VSFQRQRGQPRLGLADQVNGEEPDRQRQLRTLEHRPGNQRRLLAESVALTYFAGTADEGAVRTTHAAPGRREEAGGGPDRDGGSWERLKAEADNVWEAFKDSVQAFKAHFK